MSAHNTENGMATPADRTHPIATTSEPPAWVKQAAVWDGKDLSALAQLRTVGADTGTSPIPAKHEARAAHSRWLPNLTQGAMLAVVGVVAARTHINPEEAAAGLREGETVLEEATAGTSQTERGAAAARTIERFFAERYGTTGLKGVLAKGGRGVDNLLAPEFRGKVLDMICNSESFGTRVARFSLRMEGKVAQTSEKVGTTLNEKPWFTKLVELKDQVGARIDRFAEKTTWLRRLPGQSPRTCRSSVPP